MSNNVNWSPLPFYSSNFESEEKIISRLFDYWLENRTNFQSIEINYDFTSMESFKKNMAGQIFVNSNNLLLDTDEFEFTCYLALILIEKCDGTSKFFELVDRLEYETLSLDWLLERYAEMARDTHIVQNLIKSSELAVKKYIQQGIPFVLNRKEIKNDYETRKINWETEKHSVHDIWSDRDFNNLYWDGRKTAFSILYILDKDKFIELVQKFDNPFDVKIALETIFEQVSIQDWQYMVESSSAGFTQEGSWIKTDFLLPILFEFAFDKIERLIHSYHANTTTSQEVIDQIVTRLRELTEFIIDVLNKKNKVALFRWIAYLLKESRNNFEIVENVSVEADKVPNLFDFAKSALMLNFIKEFDWETYLNQSNANLLKWDDAEDYEDWYIHIVYGIYVRSFEENIPLKATQISSKFFDKWYLNTQNWYEVEGDLFRNGTKSFVFAGDNFNFNFDGYYYLAYLLFISLNSNDAKCWKQILLSADLFFDIQDFITYTSQEKSWNFDNTLETRYGLALFSRIGVHLTLILSAKEDNYFEFIYKSVFNLLLRGALTDRISTFYFDGFKTLLFYKIYSHIKPIPELKQIMETEPKASDYLHRFSNKNSEFIKLLNVLIANKIDETVIINTMKEVEGLELSSIINNMEKLLELNPQRYTNINKSLIREIKSIVPKL